MKRLTVGLISFILLSSSSGVPQQYSSAFNPFRQEFLNDINKLRARGCTCGTVYMRPAPPLSWNEALAHSALGHAKDMSNQNYFSHTSLDGRTMEDRIRAAGYSPDGFKSYSIGENIAFGPKTIAEVMEGWIKSPGHCKNLMNPEFKEIGVAQYNDYWVQDFGGRQAFSPEEQKLIKSGRMRIIKKYK